ncbi:RagB/SusD family nutrient uptake outer membrane protein [Mucilaginibacter sp. HMF5004]|uniref:RagB/SusD family nutrient uptake outer membrane protein n=1 Tax=Mucilaginibacter rivuli TaxID=2857527 RepID=UPI001C5F18FE|nr:RagB/SusD family nutrient uptake outer membrane protein [Mucilaginibacter rivuli]MBW4888513.1 RagB/SusD family nutrient uptake outer membrane protein [Mucilaginibacter rivuli]
MKVFSKNKLVSYTVLCVAVLTIGTISSCKKFLDVAPTDVTRDKDFLTDYWDAQYMLRGVYQELQPLTDYMFVLGEVQGDWAKPGTGADSDIIQLAEHRAKPTNRYTNWSPYYDLINRANYLIKNISRVPRDQNNFSEFMMNQYIGEVKYLRAFAYFHLVRNWGDVPFTTTPVDDISKVAYLPVTPQNTILDSVENDLTQAFAKTDFAINVFNEDGTLRQSNEQTRHRVCKGTVCSLQAEVYLWRNKYALANTACQAWQNTGQYPFILNGSASWYDIFTLGNQLFNEPMFMVSFVYATRETSTLMALTSNDPASGGKYVIAPSDVAMKTYNPNWPNSIGTSNTTDEIYRGFGASYAGSAPYYNRVGSSAPVIWKYLGTARVAAATIDVPAPVRLPYRSEGDFHITRQGDLYLLWAEALNRLGDKANAISKINSVRGRAGMPASTVTTASTNDQIEDYILRERGLELGYEGRRWYDLMRIARHGRPRVLIDAVENRAPASLKPYLEATLSDPAKWLLPYNANELQLNPNIKQH